MADDSNAIRAAFKAAFAKDWDSSDTRRLRHLCRVDTQGASKARWAAANNVPPQLRNSGDTLRRNAEGDRLRQLAAERLIEYEIDLRDRLTSGESIEDIRRSSQTSTALPASVKEWVSERLREIGIPISPGLIQVSVDIELALDRQLIDVLAYRAPEIEPSHPDTIRQLIADPTNRILLIEGSAGSGKSSLLTALELWLLRRTNQGGRPLLALKIELPLALTARPAGLRGTIMHFLGPAIETEIADGRAVVPGICLLVDGADQDTDWPRTSRELRQLASATWLSAIVVTGRPGSLASLSKLTGRYEDRDRNLRTFGALQLRLGGLRSAELVGLIRSYAQMTPEISEVALRHRVQRLLGYLDAGLATEALMERSRSPRTLVGETRSILGSTHLELEDSISPFVALLAAWLAAREADESTVTSEADLLVQVIEQWRLREAERLHDKRLTGEPDGDTLAQSQQRLVQLLGEWLVELGASIVSDGEMRRWLTSTGPNGGSIASDQVDLWLGRLSECGLVVRSGGASPGWGFAHARFAETACALSLLAAPDEAASPGERLGRAAVAWTRYLQAMGTQPRVVDTEAAPRQRWWMDRVVETGLVAREVPDNTLVSANRWLSVARLCFGLLKRDSHQLAAALLDAMATKLTEPDLLDDMKLRILKEYVFDLAAQIPMLVPGIVVQLAEGSLTPSLSVGDEHERLLESIRQDELTLIDGNLSLGDWNAAEFGVSFGKYLLNALVEELNGPAPAEALARNRASLPGYALNDRYAAACVLRLQRQSDLYISDPYIIAGAINELGSRENVTGVQPLLVKDGRWRETAAVWLDAPEHLLGYWDCVDELVDDESLDRLLIGCPKVREFLLSAMLPPIAAAPAPHSAFWISKRSATERFATECEGLLNTVGLGVSDLPSLEQPRERGRLGATDSAVDCRSDSRDLIRIGVERALALRGGGGLDPERAMGQWVGNQTLPWIARAWAGEVLVHAEPGLLPKVIDRMGNGAGSEAPAMKATDRDPWAVGMLAFGRRAIPPRFTLSAATPRNEFLGIHRGPVSELAFEESWAHFAHELLDAVIGGARTRVRDILRRMQRSRLPAGSPWREEVESDTIDRAIVVAGHLEPDLVGSALTQRYKDHLAHRYARPEERWPLDGEVWGVSGPERSVPHPFGRPAGLWRIDPWDRWKLQADQLAGTK